MLFDGSMHQLPDTDPSETQEWLDSLDSVINVHGKVRARYLLSRLLEKAQQSQVSFPATVSTPYVNTIPRDHEPWFPGDEHIERRIRAFIRWNAAAMVVRANKNAEGIGGIFQPLPVQPVCTRLVLIISFVARMTAMPVITFIFKVMQHQVFMREHF